MIKLVLLLRRKPGMTRDEFIKYYEGNHAPLALDLLPGIVAEYRRSYVLPDGMYSAPHIGDSAPLPDFDVITEMWFNSEEDLQRMFDATRDPRIGDLFKADEGRLFDTRPEAMVMFRVEERCSEIRGA